MAFGKKLLRAAIKGGIGSIPGVGAMLAALTELADTSTEDQIADIRRLVQLLTVRANNQERLIDALLVVRGEMDEPYREPLTDLQEALANPNKAPAHVIEKLDCLGERYKTPKQFAEHAQRVYAPQTIGNVGAGAVVTQIQGDANVVIVHGGEKLLELEAPAARRKRIEKALGGSDLQLLHPDMRTTKLLGRDEQLAEFVRWAKSDEAFSIRTVVGRAGAGKTRFALELLDALGANEGKADSALPPGRWCGGFLKFEELKAFGAAADLRRCDWPNPTLVVVDYAATAGALLKAWLNALAGQSSGAGQPVRVLLLERVAHGESGWLAELQRYESGGEPGLGNWFDPPQPIRMDRLTGQAIRRRLLADALGVFAGRHNVDPPPVPGRGESATFDQAIEEQQWEDPLYLIMAAAVAIGADGHKPPTTVLALSRTDLATELAAREHKRLRKGIDGKAKQQVASCLAACVTLARGLPRSQAIQMAQQIGALTELQCQGGTGLLVAPLAELLPGENGGIAAVAPDIIGEAFIHHGLAPLAAEQTHDLLLAVLGIRSPQPLELLMLLIQDYGEMWPDCLDWLDHLVVNAREEDFPLLLAIANQLPKQTLILRERAAAIYRTILQRLRTAEDPHDPSQQDGLIAGALNNLANRLSDLGRREEALKTAQEAVEIHRALAAERPDAFRPDLAMSLNNLGNMLSELGRREEALETAQEAVELYGALAAERPEAFRPNLAASLNNLANSLSDLGRREQALETAQEAVKLYRALSAERPDAFRPGLAMALSNLANWLRDLGRREQALKTAQQAVGIRRALAAERPDAFRPDLAESLNSLANTLSDLGRREEALETAQQAVDICRALAAERPDAFRPDLAMSLHNLALMLSNLGRPEQALETAQQAVELYRALAAERPDAFRPNLAASLYNLAPRLGELGRREQALGTAQEALELYRALAAERPDAFQPHLAMALNAFAVMLGALRRREQALETVQEAVELYRALAAERPDVFLADLAPSLNNLAANLSELGRPEEALETAQEAVDIYRDLAAVCPDAFRPNLAALLNTLAVMLSELGRREQALETAQEAVGLRRGLAAERPDAFRPDLAMSLSNLANALGKLGRREEAVETAQEGVDIRRALADERPDAFRPDLAGSLNNLANTLGELGRGEEALKTAQEAVDIRRALAAERPDAFRPNLAGTLDTLANTLSQLGRREEAEAAAAEAVGMLLPFFEAAPQAFGRWMVVFVRGYRESAEHIHKEPDAAMMRRVMKVFEEHPELLPDNDDAEEAPPPKR